MSLKIKGYFFFRRYPILLSQLFFAGLICAAVTPRIGWWKFDNPNSLTVAVEGYGLPLGLVGTHSATAGHDEGDGAVLIGSGSYYELIHQISPDGRGANANEYSLQFDFKIPANGVWYSFFQTNANNNDDAELFINTSGKIGVAAVGYSSLSIIPGEWYRLVVTVKNGTEFNYYIDGNLILTGNAQPVDGRFSLGDKVLVFADDDQEDGDIFCSELAIWNKCLSASEVKELGSCVMNPAYLSVRIPYLQGSGQTSMTICWHDTATVATKVEYGLDSLALNFTIFGSSEVISLPYRWHTVKLTALNPACRYYYRVSSGGLSSGIYSFKTLPPTASTSKTRYLIFGDTHSSDTTMAGKIIRAAKAKMIEKYGWNFTDSVYGILHTGDIVVNGNSPEQYTKQFFKPLSSLTPYIPTLVVAGNHESESTYFYKYLKLDELSVLPQSATLNEKIWQLRVGNSLLIGLNTNIYNQHGVIQANWLNDRLNEAEKDSDIDFIFLFFHHPPFSELWAYVNYYDGGSAYVKNSLLPVIKKYTKVKAIHYGHTHGFERGTLMAESQTGDFRIICGGGSGGYLDPWASGANEDLNDIQKTVSQYCYQLLEIDPGNKSYNNTVYSLGTLSMSGNSEVLDSWYVLKKQANPNKPNINKVEVLNDYLQIVSSEFAGIDSIMSKQIQFFDLNNTLLSDTVIHKQNVFGVDVYEHPVDLKENEYFYAFKFPRNRFVINNSYFARIRYRDNNLKWSDWSDNYAFVMSGVDKIENDGGLLRNYPNPFIDETKIVYTLNEVTNVTLSIYTLDHKLIYSLHKTNQFRGKHSIDFKSTQLNPGIYFYELKTNSSLRTGKMIKSR